LLRLGAESEIRRGVYMGVEAVFKLRVPKEYMHPKLDARLRSLRTRREAKILIHARSSGIRVPRVLAVYPDIGLIVMEYIHGRVLTDLIHSDYGRLGDVVTEAGRILGMLHDMGVVHGDPTTSNYILSDNGDVYMIDFGLAEFSEDLEDRAVDLHLFRRALESAHANRARKLYDYFLGGYTSVMGYKGLDVARRADEIRLRGRYVEARRSTAWFYMERG